MTYLILYFLLIVPAWFIAAKIFMIKGLRKAEHGSWWEDESGNESTDIGPSLYGFCWPIVLPVAFIVIVFYGIAIGYKWLDMKILNAAASFNIKIEKK